LAIKYGEKINPKVPRPGVGGHPIPLSYCCTDTVLACAGAGGLFTIFNCQINIILDEEKQPIGGHFEALWLEGTRQ
jgi:hypothetical protein